MKLTNKEVDMLHKIVEGYAKEAMQRQQETILYYQYELYDNIKDELCEAQELIIKIYSFIEVEE